MADEFEQRMERLISNGIPSMTECQCQGDNGCRYCAARRGLSAFVAAYREKCEESDREHKEKLGVASDLSCGALRARSGEEREGMKYITANTESMTKLPPSYLPKEPGFYWCQTRKNGPLFIKVWFGDWAIDYPGLVSNWDKVRWICGPIKKPITRKAKFVLQSRGN